MSCRDYRLICATASPEFLVYSSLESSANYPIDYFVEFLLEDEFASSHDDCVVQLLSQHLIFGGRIPYRLSNSGYKVIISVKDSF